MTTNDMTAFDTSRRHSTAPQQHRAPAKSGSALEKLVNQNPQAQWTAQLRSTLNPAPQRADRGVVQRVISIVPPLDMFSVFEELRSSSIYRQLDESPVGVRIQLAPDGVQTGVTSVKTHSAAELRRINATGTDAGYVVNISASEFGGSTLNPGQYYPGDFGGRGLAEPSPSTSEPRGILVGDYQVPNWDALAARFDRTPELFPETKASHSLYLIILHELGHVLQGLDSSRLYAGPVLDDVAPSDIPPVPSDLLVKTDSALEAGALWSPVWFDLHEFATVTGSWLQAVRNRWDDETIVAKAQEALELSQKVVDNASVWIEYGNITSVEHPAAEARGEPIRFTHGVEKEVGETPEIPLLDLLRRPSLPEVAKRMVKNAQKLTAGLPGVLKAFLQLYDEIEDAVRPS